LPAEPVEVLFLEHSEKSVVREQVRRVLLHLVPRERQVPSELLLPLSSWLLLPAPS